MVPIIFRDACTPAKPRKSAEQSVWQQYKELCKQKNLSIRGVECIRDMRQHMNTEYRQAQKLWVTVDGSYTNKNVMKNLPENTVLIGRIRGDAKLYFPPHISHAKAIGRKRIYGLLAPTPEQIRQSDTIPWQTVRAFASGKCHDFRVKELSGLRWRASGDTHMLKIIVIAPLRHRLNKSSPLLYRKPAYILCTDPHASIEDILQAYLWRWGIEINFRDEKSLFGVGQAQVRNPHTTKEVPQMMVAAYSLMLLAGIKQYGITADIKTAITPKWYRNNKKPGWSTMDLIKQLRNEMWAQAIKQTNFSHFVKNQNHIRSPINLHLPLSSAILANA
jgi:hypothetical protein